MPDAVQFFGMESPHVVRTLRKRLGEAINEKNIAIGSGIASDYADYRHRAGEISGLRAAIAICDEMTKEER